MKITAETRTVVKSSYALIAPDGYVNSSLPGWEDCEINVLISPEMGARFVQMLISLGKQGTGQGNTGSSELFVFALEGNSQARILENDYQLKPGSYLFVPPGSDYRFSGTDETAQLLVFKKTYQSLEGQPVPEFQQGELDQVEPEMYLEDPQLHMQYLLPDDLSFDMAINVFTYQPGGNLPFVETHIMEHGLTYLSGQGIYRLDQDWYPVQKGDTIWMAPYCPQWFVAMGKEPAVYIYYKDVNREA